VADKSFLDFSIGEVAKRSGVSASAIRYYETLGLISSERSEGGQRRYTDDALLALKYISFAQEAGFTLREIALLNDPALPGSPLFGKWKLLAERKMEQLDSVIARAQHMKRLLRFAIDCRCTRAEECGLLNIPPSRQSKRSATQRRT
jgi:MerR family redox-sensitive transcriptional activator SoxR